MIKKLLLLFLLIPFFAYSSATDSLKFFIQLAESSSNLDSSLNYYKKALTLNTSNTSRTGSDAEKTKGDIYNKIGIINKNMMGVKM